MVNLLWLSTLVVSAAGLLCQWKTDCSSRSRKSHQGCLHLWLCRLDSQNRSGSASSSFHSQPKYSCRWQFRCLRLYTDLTRYAESKTLRFRKLSFSLYQMNILQGQVDPSLAQSLALRKRLSLSRTLWLQKYLTKVDQLSHSFLLKVMLTSWEHFRVTVHSFALVSALSISKCYRGLDFHLDQLALFTLPLISFQEEWQWRWLDDQP